MDLDALQTEYQARVGQTTHVSDWLEITQERVNTFAEATGDRNWIHVDPERAARESPFGGPIAHGYLTLSLIPLLRGIADAGNPVIDQATAVLNYGSNRVRFPNSVRVGARVRGRFELVSVAPAGPGALQFVERCTVEIDGQEKPGCVAEVILRAYFIPVG